LEANKRRAHPAS